MTTKPPALSVFGVPLHSVVNDLPASLLPVASVCDALYLATGRASWASTAFHALQIGNAAAVVAGTLGVLDYLRLPRRPDVQRLGRRHAMLNGLLLPAFMLCQWLRRSGDHRPSAGAALLLLIANIGLAVSAWHGSQLVYRHGVRVAQQDAASDDGERDDQAEEATSGAPGTGAHSLAGAA